MGSSQKHSNILGDLWECFLFDCCLNTKCDVLFFEGDDRSAGEWWRYRVGFML